jgi:hypothetical protein
MLRGDDAIRKARAIQLLASMGDEGTKVVTKSLADPDENIRIAAFRALRVAGVDIVPAAGKLMTDPSSACVARSRSQCATFRTSSATGFSSRWQLDTTAAIASTSKRSASAARGRNARSLTCWLGTWAWAIRSNGRMRWRTSPGAASAGGGGGVCGSRAGGASGAGGAATSLTAIAFTADEKAADAMDHLRASSLADVRPVADWWLKNRGGNEWKDFAAARHYAAAALDDEKAKKQATTKYAARRENDLKRIANASLPRASAKSPPRASPLIRKARCRSSRWPATRNSPLSSCRPSRARSIATPI